MPDGSGNPLHKHEGLGAGVTCPVCGKPARRETDTMDTFVDSSWYFMRYCDPPKRRGDGRRQNSDYWMPMDQYIGGIEHAILHLLYARFWTKVMRRPGLVKVDEPFTLLTQGMVLNHIYSRKPPKGGIDISGPRRGNDLDDGPARCRRQLKRRRLCRWTADRLRGVGPCRSPRTTASTRRT